ncbi:methyltransferase domain-containing protein [Rhizosaccharibacter radicis]|uniref:Methyltransferase domain-containing protein n=1 Tax=Rhizosaccharibacter radicis TaxID=2782605 RepID=A0ABT1VXS6_9PROT|nr:methyltransferase domain-containing protein [Acetobacteraceae bacterium KSS12]
MPTTPRSIAPAASPLPVVPFAWPPAAPIAGTGHRDLSPFAAAQVWQLLDEALVGIALGGRRDITILQLGCGEGGWLRRLAMRADALGFNRIRVRGVEPCNALIGRAAAMAAEATRSLPVGRLCLSVEHGEPETRLRDPDASIDLVLCFEMSGAPARVARLAGELARVTANRLCVVMPGREAAPTAASGTVAAILRERLDRVRVRGLDLFHERFGIASGDGDPVFLSRLDELERFHAEDPAFIDHAAHILLTAERRRH